MKKIHVAAAVIFSQNRILIAKRPDNKEQGGLWEFPGGKLEQHESSIQCLLRELREELDIVIENPDFYHQEIYKYPDKQVTLDFYFIREFSGLAKGNERQEIKWVDPVELSNYSFPPANEQLVKKLLKYLVKA
ncbi:MAG: 8-oxo-dGTP diphosphatase MutT [Gammaproteobacteria bacterium]|nr:8-oxo-dGTP diphosphatase MutT [Gammaproteobacteria bacterium]MDH5629081.1 8-oxo-dGTP diphosphatase MutT [Gammaproteobacteria bacterium]